jgi:hypothetical protein
MLFAIATQPIILWLACSLQYGILAGIRISPLLTVSLRLFADDMGMFLLATSLAF